MWHLPQFVLHQGSGGPAVVGLQPAKLLVAAVVLLNEHSGPPALLELLLLVVAAEFTLDKDGGLRHLLIKCILLTRTEQHIVNTAKNNMLLWVYAESRTV